MKKSESTAILSGVRELKTVHEGSALLGPLEKLPGTWKSEGLGWNLIALPFANGSLNYRLLMNQYDEVLSFTKIDERVPNRGIPSIEFPPEPDLPENEKSDQFVTTLDYEQSIKQVAAVDIPVSGLPKAGGKYIHHEPGLFLNMLNKKTNDIDIARLAIIPYGDSVLALGQSSTQKGSPKIPVASVMPLRISSDLTNPYLEPYKVFTESPFKGVVNIPGFPGFSPKDANTLLHLANVGVQIKETTTLHFDTTIETGGIENIPFIVKQENTVELTSTFWVQELEEEDIDGNPVLRLKSTQSVLLDFFSVPGS